MSRSYRNYIDKEMNIEEYSARVKEDINLNERGIVVGIDPLLKKGTKGHWKDDPDDEVVLLHIEKKIIIPMKNLVLPTCLKMKWREMTGTKQPHDKIHAALDVAVALYNMFAE